MLLNPSILALVMVSLVVSGMSLIAGGFALQLLRHWDIRSGSERQLRLERRTYLISTLMAFAFLAELVSLLLFVYNAEQMSGQFVGAMCATGVLNLNPWGWPTLILKMAIFFAASAWLTLNRIDNLAFDYPLIRAKYGLLLLILPLMLAESLVQARFFLEMNPDIITSCCGALFTPEGSGVAAEISGIEPATSLIWLMLSGLAVFASGLWFLWRGRGGMVFSFSSLLAFGVALVAIVSCIALYVYEHPHHHCPFCILKRGHDFIGYYLYLPLFVSTALAMGVGVIAPFRNVSSLAEIIPAESRRFVLTALMGMAMFYAVSAYAMLSSKLTLIEVWWQ